MTTDDEIRAAAKVDAHERVMKKGGPIHLSMGEMVNVGVDTGIDFERMRIMSVVRRRAVVTTQPGMRDYLLALAAQIEDGVT